MLEKLLGIGSAEGNELPVTYKPGQLTVSENGLLLSTGLQSRIIAITGEPITFKDGSKSSIPFHDQPDAGAIFEDYSADNPGGYAYVSNAEVGKQGGGVGSIIFDADGDPIDYKMILTGTTRNCGGGKTYWQTVSPSNTSKAVRAYVDSTQILITRFLFSYSLCVPTIFLSTYSGFLVRKQEIVAKSGEFEKSLATRNIVLQLLLPRESSSVKSLTFYIFLHVSI
jgi:hypothetical protein